MDAREVIENFQDKNKYDLCCSESIFYASSKYYNLNFDNNTYKLAAAFCGGNLTEDTCGLLTTSIAIIAVMFCESNSHNSPLMKSYIKEYIEIFNQKYTSSNCGRLKELYRKDNVRCKNFIIDSFVTLTNYIDSKLIA
ncbi:MAG: C-GCAxxG-C-C family (seleno)protein [Bacilli bacterium]